MTLSTEILFKAMIKEETKDFADILHCNCDSDNSMWEKAALSLMRKVYAQAKKDCEVTQ